MTRPILVSLAARALRGIDHIVAPATVDAHCDVPCGIYDPHYMQIAALTVIRMNQLIDALEKPGDSKDDQAKYHNSLGRYVAVKEEHAEIVKREARIIWGDYFKPEHTDKYKDLHATVWNIMKLASTCRQQVNAQAGQDLLAATQKFAEMFWDSKGATTSKVASRQAVGGEVVVPNA